MPSREKRIEIRLFTTEKAAAIWSGLYLTLGGSSLQKKKKEKAKQEPNSSYWNRWRGNNVICNRSGKSGEAMHCLLLNIVTPVFGTLLKADCWTTTSYWINFCKYFPHYIENQEYFSAINLLIQLIPLSPVQKKKLSIAFIHSLILLIPLLTF